MIRIFRDERRGYGGSLEQVRYPWDIFSKNGKGIEADFALLTKGRKSAPLSASNRVIAPERVFLEPGAKAGARS